MESITTFSQSQAKIKAQDTGIELPSRQCTYKGCERLIMTMAAARWRAGQTTASVPQQLAVLFHNSLPAYWTAPQPPSIIPLCQFN